MLVSPLLPLERLLDTGDRGLGAPRPRRRTRAAQRTTWKLYGPPDAPNPQDPLLSSLSSPPPAPSLLHLSPPRVSFLPTGFFLLLLLLQAGVDFTAETNTDHAMTERALGTSTESITGNPSNAHMLLQHI